MAVCVLLSSFTEEGRRKLRNNPEKIKESNKALEALGIHIVGQYALIGQYDLLEIFEGESKEAVCKAALDLADLGSSQTIALMGMNLDEFSDAVKK